MRHDKPTKSSTETAPGDSRNQQSGVRIFFRTAMTLRSSTCNFFAAEEISWESWGISPLPSIISPVRHARLSHRVGRLLAETGDKGFRELLPFGAGLGQFGGERPLVFLVNGHDP